MIDEDVSKSVDTVHALSVARAATFEINHPPIVLTDLVKTDEGRRIAYTPKHQRAMEIPNIEYGYISSWNDTYIFVRFETMDWDGNFTLSHSKACNPADLHWP